MNPDILYAAKSYASSVNASKAIKARLLAAEVAKITDSEMQNQGAFCRMAARKSWAAMCTHDGIDVTESEFVVFSPDNPHLLRYNAALECLMATNRELTERGLPVK